MNVIMARGRVKPERVEDAEVGVRSMFAAFNEAHPEGFSYAFCKLSDGVTFVAVAALVQPYPWLYSNAFRIGL